MAARPLGVKWGAVSLARRKIEAAAAAGILLPGKCVLPVGNPDRKRKTYIRW